MNTKSVLAAIALALAISSPTHAATFDFSFDASTATGGDTSMMASGTLDIDVAPGTSFSSGDVSNVDITVISAVFGSFNLDTASGIAGVVAVDGFSAVFSDFLVSAVLDPFDFGCRNVACIGGDVIFEPGSGETIAMFGSQAAALNSFSATAQVSAVPLPAGGLLLLSGLAGVAGLKRRKKRAA